MVLLERNRRSFLYYLTSCFYACKRLKITLKKRKKDLQELEKIPLEDRVYIDESGIDEYLARKYARSTRELKCMARFLD